jgi:hypothetical protein
MTKKSICFLALILFVSEYAIAQITADQAIGLIDQLPASRLDAALPRTPFLNWLKELVGPAAKIQWEMNDCGELTGVAAVDEERDISVCMEATIDLTEGRRVGIAIRVGSEKKGLTDSPAIANIYLEAAGDVVYFKKLSELQQALNAPKVKK